MAPGIAGVLLAAWVASAARAGPCEPPLTLDQCDLLVSSGLTDNVLRYDGVTGAFVGEFVAAGSGGLDAPFGLAFGPDGNLYVGSGGTDPRVKRYDGATGAFLDDFTQAFPAPVWLIAFGPDGNLYLVSGRFIVRVNGTTGTFIDNFVDLGLGEVATSVTFGPDGDLYVSSAPVLIVQRFDGTTGDFIDVFAESVDGNPGQVAFLPDGDALVGLLTGDDIVRLDGTTGDLEGSFIPALDPRPDSPYGFVFGPDGNLYVPSSESDEVLRYNGTSGAFIDVFASGGGLDQPSNVVFVPEPGHVLLVATGVLVLAAVRGRRGA
jgi:WD40 repeat protein